jgi:hypothetical protein
MFIKLDCNGRLRVHDSAIAITSRANCISAAPEGQTPQQSYDYIASFMKEGLGIPEGLIGDVLSATADPHFEHIGQQSLDELVGERTPEAARAIAQADRAKAFADRAVHEKNMNAPVGSAEWRSSASGSRASPTGSPAGHYIEPSSGRTHQRGQAVLTAGSCRYTAGRSGPKNSGCVCIKTSTPALNTAMTVSHTMNCLRSMDMWPSYFINASDQRAD